jgi:hypothetical protein
MHILRYWRAGVVILMSATAVLGIPSLPQHRYHLAYWCAAFVLEGLLIAVTNSVTAAYEY